jgi:peptide chain release factor 1
MTEVQQPQLSPDLVRIMERRLSAIEHRSACLHNLINQVILFIFINKRFSYV